MLLVCLSWIFNTHTHTQKKEEQKKKEGEKVSEDQSVWGREWGGGGGVGVNVNPCCHAAPQPGRWGKQEGGEVVHLTWAPWLPGSARLCQSLAAKLALTWRESGARLLLAHPAQRPVIPRCKQHSRSPSPPDCF